MRGGSCLALILVLVACQAGDAGKTTVTTGTTVATSTTATTAPSTTVTTQPPPPCPPAPYELGFLPPTVRPAESSDTADDPDEFTSIGGTHVRLWVGSEDRTAIALIRGSLPPRDFPAEKGEVQISGSRGIAGPYPDGKWVVAWFNEPGDRCDQYTMVFYPPVSPAEVEQTISEMVRTPG